VPRRRSARIGAARAAAQIGSQLRDSLAAGGKLPGRTVNDIGVGVGVGVGNWVAWRREANGFLERVVAAIQQHMGVDEKGALQVIDAVIENQTSEVAS
jgi:hypothetical protein